MRPIPARRALPVGCGARDRARSIFRSTVLAVASVAAVSVAHASTGSALTLDRVGFDQHPGTQVPLDTRFRDEHGSPISLGRYFGRRPVVLVMTYYECPNLCTIVLNGLVNGLRHVSFDAGQGFDVVALSISPRETPRLAASKKAAYVARYGRPGAAAGWHFLTGEEAQIERVARSIGFRYFYDEKLGEYAHAAGLVLLTPEGRIASYLPGVAFPPAELRRGLAEASRRQVSSIVDRLWLLCYHYDPATGRYSVIVERVLQLAGIVTVVALGGLIGMLALRERARRRARS